MNIRETSPALQITPTWETLPGEVPFKKRKLALLQQPHENKRILPFVTQYHPAVPNLKQIPMKSWHLIAQQSLLKEIYKDPPVISYKRGRSLKNVLVRAKLWKNYVAHTGKSRRPVTHIIHSWSRSWMTCHGIWLVLPKTAASCGRIWKYLNHS